jgi:hypothetical protein
MSVNSRDIRWKKIVCEDLTVGEAKEFIIDPSSWKVTHLEVALTKNAAELAFGARKGGIRNLLTVSAIGKVNKFIKFRVEKEPLQIYLKPPKRK